jgi:hypothetical protein
MGARHTTLDISNRWYDSTTGADFNKRYVDEKM